MSFTFSLKTFTHIYNEFLTSIYPLCIFVHCPLFVQYRRNVSCDIYKAVVTCFSLNSFKSYVRMCRHGNWTLVFHTKNVDLRFFCADCKPLHDVSSLVVSSLYHFAPTPRHPNLRNWPLNLLYPIWTHVTGGGKGLFISIAEIKFGYWMLVQEGCIRWHISPTVCGKLLMLLLNGVWKKWTYKFLAREIERDEMEPVPWTSPAPFSARMFYCIMSITYLMTVQKRQSVHRASERSAWSSINRTVHIHYWTLRGHRIPAIWMLQNIGKRGAFLLNYGTVQL